MSVHISYTQHCGYVSKVQQDALWDGRQCVQVKNSGVAYREVASDPLLLAVADGVAISPSPHLASRFVVQNLARLVKKNQYLDTKAIRTAHENLCQRYAKGSTFGSSTTLVTAYIHNDRCSIFNIGDSRAYRLSKDGNFTQLSQDHTVLNSMIASGEAKPDIEYASMYDALEYCLIADPEEYEFPIHQQSISLADGNCVLLCSDGLHDVISDTSIKNILLQNSHTAGKSVLALREAVLDAGAPDNFSIELAYISD